MSEWIGCTLEEAFESTGFGSPRRRCGERHEIARQLQAGVRAFGVDAYTGALRICRGKDLKVTQGRAEQLPFPDGRFDGVVCRVMLPYTNERDTVLEIGRILRREGRAYIVTHALTYYLRYLFASPQWKQSVYAARTILNTWTWATTQRRLLGFLGDTIYQSRGRLRLCYRRAGLIVERERAGATFLGHPAFFYDVLRKA